MKASDPLARRDDDAPLFSIGTGGQAKAEQAKASCSPAPSSPVQPSSHRALRPLAETSLAARAEQMSKPNRHYASIVRFLGKFGPGTHKEWCRVAEAESNTSGRFTELSEAGVIVDTTDRRDGARLWSLSGSGLELLPLSDDQISHRVRELLESCGRQSRKQTKAA